MRNSDNRQTVSSTSRWNLVQSDPSSPGAQKKPLKNQQTGQGSNIDSLRRALAKAELHESSTIDPSLLPNIRHGITLLKAQIARISGVDYTGIDVNEIHDSSTGYHYAGKIDAKSDFESTARMSDAVDQTPISSFAQFQLFGTLRQKITKVDPPKNATPAGSLMWPGPPDSRSNVIRNLDNPNGSVFPVNEPGDNSGIPVVQDTRDQDYSGAWYHQDDPGTHLRVYSGNGVIPSKQDIARGKHGQYLAGYSFTGA
jgi:hypothetical protein